MAASENSRKWSKKASKNRRKKFADHIQQTKLKVGCEICGYNEHSCALQFDHRDPSQKLFNIAHGKDHSWKSFLAEIAKCRVLCANCHAIQTHS